MTRRVPQILRVASKELRRPMTVPEQRLWRHLRDRQLGGFKFRRQHTIGDYILDFYCAEQGLVVEVDGSQHVEPEAKQRDADRTDYLESNALRVLRFSNDSVIRDTDSVLKAILEALEAPSP